VACWTLLSDFEEIHKFGQPRALINPMLRLRVTCTCVDYSALMGLDEVSVWKVECLQYCTVVNVEFWKLLKVLNRLLN